MSIGIVHEKEKQPDFGGTEPPNVVNIFFEDDGDKFRFLITYPKGTREHFSGKDLAVQISEALHHDPLVETATKVEAIE